MQKDDLRTIGFAASVCLVCSLLLAGLHTALKPMQVANKALDNQKNILKALNPDFKPQGNGFVELSEEERRSWFVEGKVPAEMVPKYMELVSSNAVTYVLPKTDKKINDWVYTLNKDGEAVAIAFAAEGKGLWSTIHSYVGLQADKKTVRGITFFDHGETPGLGGECSAPWFQVQWQGKTFKDETGDFARIIVEKGAADDDDPHAVDGMSGATITGKGIEKFVNEVYVELEKQNFGLSQTAALEAK